MTASALPWWAVDLLFASGAMIPIWDGEVGPGDPHRPAGRSGNDTYRF